MNRNYILYNPLAGNGSGKQEAEVLKVIYEQVEIYDITHITNYRAFFSDFDEEDNIIICGGDGTLNRFVNETSDLEMKSSIYFYSVGTGNDFARDIGIEQDSKPTFRINEYLEKLPIVSINDEKKYFINGVGFGIDGYCCEVGDKLKNSSDKPVNYTSIAIKGLLFHYKPTNATVTVDGKRYSFKKVWIAPTMNGRYYGGGMMAAPKQKRIEKDKELSLVLMHGAGRLRTLCVFPSIFKGEHIKHEKTVKVIRGKDILVEFDRPTALQIDGETVMNVKKYHAMVS